MGPEDNAMIPNHTIFLEEDSVLRYTEMASNEIGVHMYQYIDEDGYWSEPYRFDSQQIKVSVKQ